MGRASISRSSCLAVVPEETNEWNPEAAPQAITMNTKGNIGGAPFRRQFHGGSGKLRAQHEEARVDQSQAEVQQQGVEKIARLQQRPDRQHRGDPGVGQQHPGPAVLRLPVETERRSEQDRDQRQDETRGGERAQVELRAGCTSQPITSAIARIEADGITACG